MNDIVLMDLHQYLNRRDQEDAQYEAIESEKEEIVDDYLSSAQRFAEIAELFYHDDLDWPLEDRFIRLVMANNQEDILDVAMELRLLLKNKLNHFAKNLATAKVKLALID